MSSELGAVEAAVGIDPAFRGDVEDVVVPEQAERGVQSGNDLDRIGTCFGHHVQPVLALIGRVSGGHPQAALWVEGQGRDLRESLGVHRRFEPGRARQTGADGYQSRR